MRNSIKLLGGLLMSSLLAQSANAVNLTITAGQADFDISYKVAYSDNSGSSSGAFSDNFDYYNVGLSVERGNYTFGVNATGLLEKEVDEYVNGVFDGKYDTSRSSYAVSVARPISNNLSLSGGYYASEVVIESDPQGQIQGDDTIETQALFASLTYSDRLNDTMSWYSRVGVQINEAELTVNSDSGRLNETLDGSGYLVGAGIFYPLSDTTGLTFGAEFKEFNYDGGRWDLSEDQTLLTAGYNFQF